MISLSKGDICQTTEDILSGEYYKNKQVPYAWKGDKVTVVAVHDDVIIVHDTLGSSFPVHISKLKKLKSAIN